MKFLILLFFLCIVKMQAKEDWNFNVKSKEEVQKYWQKFKSTFNRRYENEAEEHLRKHIFLDQVLEVSRHNEKYAKRLVSFRKGINKFSDMPFSEFREKMLVCSKGKTSNKTREAVKFVPPVRVKTLDSVDWRLDGAVTDVKSQELCGSCYAFSAIGALEGQHFLKTDDLLSLSEQQIVDCSIKGYRNDGCRGGYVEDSFTYIKDNNGVETGDSYQYKGLVGKCNFDPDYVRATDVGYGETDVEESHLEAAVATLGPIAVCIEATDNFRAYQKGGVFYDPDCQAEPSANHCVLVVGYGTDPDEAEYQDYWIVKNSWGEDWGEDGYIRMARNANNNCGIVSEATYPLV